MREKKLRASPRVSAMSSPKLPRKMDVSQPHKLTANKSNEDLIEELEMENTAEDQVIE